MCGRFTLLSSAETISERFQVEIEFRLYPRYNIAPTQPVLAVRLPGGDHSTRELTHLHWGLIPWWSRDASMGGRMMNVRAESVQEKPSYRSAFKRRRCLIPADGFYEWQAGGNGKQPYYIHREDGAPFAFAGLWENWHGPDGEEIESCAIITTEANERMRAIHKRMPVIVPEHGYARWLSLEGEPDEELIAMLTPGEWDGMTFYRVSTYVNAARNEGEACIAPLLA